MMKGGGMGPGGAQGGMMGAMLGGMGMQGLGKVSKKDLTTLTRTDFLLQFLWVPLKPEEQPKSGEDLRTRVADIKTKMDEVEKNHPAVAMPSDKDIEAASLRASDALNKAVEKALSGPAPGAAGAGGATPLGAPPGTSAVPTPGFGPPAGGTAPPATPAPGAAAPQSG